MLGKIERLFLSCGLGLVFALELDWREDSPIIRVVR